MNGLESLMIVKILVVASEEEDFLEALKSMTIVEILVTKAF